MILFLLLLIGCLHGELIDVEGRKLFYQCEGIGRPPVILISGRGDRSDIWNPVIEGVKPYTKVCAYDRPGTFTINGDDVQVSRSSEVKQPRSLNDSVSDLHALLMKVPGPYILVAHSYGGMIARLYASLYPKEIAGLILIDIPTEMLYDSLKDDEKALWLKLNSNYSPDLDRYALQERNDLLQNIEAMRSTHVAAPTIVISADKTFDFKGMIEKGILPKGTPLEFGDITFKAHLKGQDELAKKLHAKHITETHSGHYIQVEQPQLVIDAILEIVKRIKANP